MGVCVCACTRVFRDWLIYTNWFMRLFGLASLRFAGQAGDPGKSWCWPWVWRPSAGRSLASSGGPQSFPLKAFNWVGEAHSHHAGWSPLLKFHWFKGSCHPKTIFMAASRLTFNQISGYRDLAKLTHEINPHRQWAWYPEKPSKGLYGDCDSVFLKSKCFWETFLYYFYWINQLPNGVNSDNLT